jgi:hypothetical protein
VAVLTALIKAKAATYSLVPVADARVLNFYTDQTVNYASDILSVYTDSTTPNIQRTFIQFDLTPIALAGNEYVQSATLTLTALTYYGDNSAQKPMEIYRVLAPWTETGLTWSNRDATHAWTNAGGDFVGTNGQPYAVSTASPMNGQPVTWDVTALVREWLTNGSPNYGLLLKSEDGNHLIFNQREGTFGPKLTVITGLPSFHAYSSGGQVVLWWTNANTVLQEKTNLNPAVAWSDSGRTVAQSKGTNSVTISVPNGNNFFRLRSGP